LQFEWFTVLCDAISAATEFMVLVSSPMMFSTREVMQPLTMNSCHAPLNELKVKPPIQSGSSITEKQVPKRARAFYSMDSSTNPRLCHAIAKKQVHVLAQNV
jgi:hypothetical protein